MAFALVGSAGTVATGTGSVSPTFAQPTTAGNLLVAWVTSYTGDITSAGSPPSGWSVGINVSAATDMVIFFKANCGAGESAPTFTAAAGTMFARLAEFSGGETVSPGEWGGNATGLSSPDTITAGGADLSAGELVLSVTAYNYSMSATKTTSHSYNNGASSTAVSNDATSTATHYRMSYGITTGNASADTMTDTFTVTNITGRAAGRVSFKVGAAAGKAPPVSNIRRRRSMQRTRV